jgi:TRAP-type uncharacterized transport system substrate-binding protein
MKHLKAPKSAIQDFHEQVTLEIHAWRVLFRKEWPLVLILISLLVVLVVYARPFPPRTLGMSVGQTGTSSAIYGEALADYFLEHGVTLRLIHTEETESTVDAMIGRGDIDSALLLSGMFDKRDAQNIVSLGSVQYQPFWLFYRGETVQVDSPLEYFFDKKLAVGLPGTASLRVYSELLATRGLDLLNKPNILGLPYQAGADALIAGEIDAMIIVSGIDAPVIQSLIHHPDIKLINFPLASAYIKKLPHLDLVSIPRGSLNLKEVHPKEKIDMVSGTLNIVVEKDLHPALQLLFLMAADHLGDSRSQFFAKPDEFPSHKDQTIPLSHVAKEYVAKGAPVWTRYAPFWLASLIDRMWVLLVGLFAVAYPLYKMLPNYRTVQTQRQIASAYGSLRETEEAIRFATTQEEFTNIDTYLQGLENEIAQLNISDDDLNRYFSMLAHVSIVRRMLQERRAAIK